MVVVGVGFALLSGCFVSVCVCCVSLSLSFCSSFCLSFCLSFSFSLARFRADLDNNAAVAVEDCVFVGVVVLEASGCRCVLVVVVVGCSSARSCASVCTRVLSALSFDWDFDNKTKPTLPKQIECATSGLADTIIQ